MISASDVLQILSEVHQYSMILLELMDATTVGISHSADGKLNCFLFEGTLGLNDRKKLVREVSHEHTTELLKHLPVERLLSLIEGKRTKHIWLETRDPERKEMAFVSITELKAYLRIHSKR
jgi:hypothetical protein